ncbi:phosphatidyl-myo-inositol dimannoside synthase [Methylomarinovum caldicuralii]|uniref:Phosphatidyl-myo-inositol dimannoside synthase n=1 Tax=Methylomarinovum caldicuralii TaxID=438856 RepID=A0AAU9C7X3_9GAMM|nr:glycosyltransferase family 4 protein [Methylomarinovum caldicuralii]BCX82139.1 phosphatidyl-myo-inositol dimannoside synthase [Methylomarinovum caldicuralii]
MSKNGLLVITELFLPTKGGTAVWFDEVYRRLGGKEIHIVTARVPDCETHDRDHPNTVHRLRLQRHWWLRPESLAMYAKFLARSLAVTLRHPIAAVHAGRVLPEGLVGLIVARLCGKPLVVYAHGEEITGWRQPAKFRAMVFTYRHADTVIANSDFTRRELLKIGVPEQRIVKISPGVDVARFRPGLPTRDLFQRLNIPPDTPLILSVGRLSPRKGFDQVIRALPRVLERIPAAHYAVIGIGGDEARLKNLAQECRVSERVHFLGHVFMAELPRWYNACSVFAMPNREINGDNEGFGMVFLEAGACGRPSLAGIAGGTGDAVAEGITGLRVDGSSVAAVAEGLVLLLTRPPRADISEYIRSRHSWEQVADRTRKLPQVQSR